MCVDVCDGRKDPNKLIAIKTRTEFGCTQNTSQFDKCDTSAKKNENERDIVVTTIMTYTLKFVFFFFVLK